WRAGRRSCVAGPGTVFSASFKVMPPCMVRRSVTAGMPEAASTTLAALELADTFQLRLHHRHQYQLGDALTRLDGEGLMAAVPAGHHQLALVIRIDQPHQIAQHDAVLVAQAGARQ